MKFFMTHLEVHMALSLTYGVYIMTLLYILLLIQFVWYSTAAPQQPEINDQFQPIRDRTSNDTAIQVAHTITLNTTATNPILKIYKGLTFQITRIIWAPKVQSVLRNIGTCVVNGAMDLVTYYFPAPIIPLLASAAGTLIPFEPVVMLRRQMPVNSYRRAFTSALNGFLNTFDGYKNFDDDPYMTQRFNRRFMRGSNEKQN